MKKRILSLVLVVAMLLCVLPAASAAEGDPKLATYYLSLSDSIAINFKVSNWTEGTTVTVNGEAKQPKSVNDGVALFSYTDLSPAEIAKPVAVSINGAEAKNLTVLGYCSAILAGDYSGTMKRLAADLVNFGIAFHTYKNDSSIPAISAPAKTDDYASVVAPALTDNRVSNNLIADGVSLNDRVELYFVANDADEIKVTVDGKTYSLTAENGKFYFDKLNPAGMRKLVAVQAYAGGEKLGTEFVTSIESYAAYCNAEANAEAAVTLAMMKYGDAVAAYVAQPAANVVLEEDFSYKAAVWGNGPVAGVAEVNAAGAFEVKLAGGNQSFKKDFNKEQKGVVSIEWDYKLDPGTSKNVDGGIVVKDKAGNSILNVAAKHKSEELGFLFVTCDQTGGVKYNNNWTDVQCVENTTYRLKVVIDTATDLYDFYVDGERKIIGGVLRHDKTEDVLDVNGLVIDVKNAETNDTTVIFDNFVVKKVMDTVGAPVEVFKDDFSSGVGNWQTNANVTAADGAIKLAVPKNTTTNIFIRLKNAPTWDFTGAKFVVVEYDITTNHATDATTAFQSKFMLKTTASGNPTTLNLGTHTDKIVNNGSPLYSDGSLLKHENKQHHVKAVINMSTGAVELFVDGNNCLLAANKGLKVTSGVEFGQLALQVQPAAAYAEDQYALFDNITITKY